MFDRSPLGLNHWLGLRFRCMLGRHIFEHMGTGVKIYHGVDLTYGYKLSIGDGVTIRQRALLNDRGGIKIGDRAVIGSFARILFPLARCRGLREGSASTHCYRRGSTYCQSRHCPGRSTRRARGSRRRLPRPPPMNRAGRQESPGLTRPPALIGLWSSCCGRYRRNALVIPNGVSHPRLFFAMFALAESSDPAPNR